MADEDGCVSIVNTAGDESLPTYLKDDPSPSVHGRRPSAQWFAHRNAIFDVSWSNQDRWMYTASGDTTLALWDTAYATRLITFSKHEGSVKTLSVSPSTPEVFASGARDGSLCVWDARISPCHGRHVVATAIDTDAPHVHPVITVPCPHARKRAPPSTIRDRSRTSGTGTGSGVGGRGRGRRRATLLGKSPEAVTAVQFLGDGIGSGHAVASGGIDGSIQIWDVRRVGSPSTRRRTPLREISPTDLRTEETLASSEAKQLALSRCPNLGGRDYAITSLSLRPDGSGQLLASFMGGHHLLYDVTRPEVGPLRWFGGHEVASFYVKASFSPDGGHIVSGSSDSKVYIWRVDGPADSHGTTHPHVLRGHDAEVTTVAWCPSDFSQLATAADDYTVKVWSIDRQQQREDVGFESPLGRQRSRFARALMLSMQQQNVNAGDRDWEGEETPRRDKEGYVWGSKAGRIDSDVENQSDFDCERESMDGDDVTGGRMTAAAAENGIAASGSTMLSPTTAAIGPSIGMRCGETKMMVGRAASVAEPMRHHRMRISNALRQELSRDRSAKRKQQTLEEALRAATNRASSGNERDNKVSNNTSTQVGSNTGLTTVRHVHEAQDGGTGRDDGSRKRSRI